MKMYSRMVLVMMFGSTLSFGQSVTTLEEALGQGEFQGTIGWFGQHVDAKGSTQNSGFSNGYVNIGFETAPIHGVSLGVSGWGSAKTSEKNDGDYRAMINDQTALSQAYVKIEHEGMGKVILGRQAVDFNWLGDYIDGATVELSFVENLVLTMAWARKYSVIDIDEISESFTKLNGSRGIYMLEAKYTPLEALELNPYLYYGDDLLGAYGLKTTLNLAPTEEIKTKTIAHYLVVDAQVPHEKDGSFAQIEQNIEFLGATMGVGYIKVDKNGISTLGTFGDQLPFEEHVHTFSADAKTPYVSASYTYDALKLNAIYGETTYMETIKIKEKELNVSIGYDVLKNLETSLMYVHVKNDNASQSYDALKAHIAYKF